MTLNLRKIEHIEYFHINFKRSRNILLRFFFIDFIIFNKALYFLLMLFAIKVNEDL